MVACQQNVPLLQRRRSAPPALDESSISEVKDGDFLDWTFTPNLMVLKDGHTRCFIATAQPAQETKRPGLHLVREFELQPSILDKKNKDRKQRSGKKPLEIRVREEDLRKHGANLERLSQCALPRMDANILGAMCPKEAKTEMLKKYDRLSKNMKRLPGCEPLQSLPEAGQLQKVPALKRTSSVPLASHAEAGQPQRRASVKHSSSVPSLGRQRVKLPALGSTPAAAQTPEKKRQFALTWNENGGSTGKVVDLYESQWHINRRGRLSKSPGMGGCSSLLGFSSKSKTWSP